MHLFCSLSCHGGVRTGENSCNPPIAQEDVKLLCFRERQISAHTRVPVGFPPPALVQARDVFGSTTSVLFSLF